MRRALGKQTRPVHIGLICRVPILNPYNTSDTKTFWEAVADRVAVGEDRGLCRADVFRVRSKTKIGSSACINAGVVWEFLR